MSIAILDVQYVSRLIYNTLSAYEISFRQFSCLSFCFFHESRKLYQVRLQWKSSMSDVVAVASFFCDLAPQLGCWLAARQMHIVMLRAVMRAPLTFFDTTPIGRIISRFAKDVDVLDTSLPPQISDTIYCLFEVISFAACHEYRLGISYHCFSRIFSTSQFEFHTCTVTSHRRILRTP